MKKIEGYLHILIGLCFIFLRVPIINLKGIWLLSRENMSYIDNVIANGVYEPISYSLVPIVIGLLFIILGTIKIREVMISAK